MAKAKLESVLTLVDMQVSASQADLHSVLQRETQLTSLLQNLDLMKVDAGSQAEGPRLSMADFQNNVRMRRWIDQRRASVNIELAQVRALIVIRRDQLAHHFSRQQALQKLTLRTDKIAAQKAARTITYGY